MLILDDAVQHLNYLRIYHLRDNRSNSLQPGHDPLVVYARPVPGLLHHEQKGEVTMTYAEKCKCPHNEGVHCPPDTRKCEGCGWTPEVKAARLEKFCQSRGIELPGSEKES